MAMLYLYLSLKTEPFLIVAICVLLRRASIFNYVSGPLLKLVCASYMTDAKLICKMNPPIKLTDPPLGKVIGHL